MKTSTALSRPITHERMQAMGAQPQDIARKIALAWMDTQSVDAALMNAGRGIALWHVAPAVQNAAAAAIADLIDADTRVITAGIQPWGWMVASGLSMADIGCVYLGKQLPRRVMHVSAEDVTQHFEKDAITIVAMHIESSSGWNDVRTISAAAVRAQTPMLMVVSTAVPAPEGVTIELASDWNVLTANLRDGMRAVRDMGTIRVVAIQDMPLGGIERTMMESAAMSPESWVAAMQKNNDGAESAMNTAYQAPVESF
ncbi:MAG: hypothetical protein H6865_01175 [Rhodospirillales bacterium]|nr:hypothetical protein [Alphaproteobacteria bacterium]MCB9986238.1 hypothetical protein [Rhodospirillales bacterium]USO07207.1 MAG: hypothetical protein H6866_07195 [Rhodospirillales bacterium]